MFPENKENDRNKEGSRSDAQYMFRHKNTCLVICMFPRFDMMDCRQVFHSLAQYRYMDTDRFVILNTCHRSNKEDYK